jgi:hypothetical protein
LSKNLKKFTSNLFAGFVHIGPGPTSCVDVCQLPGICGDREGEGPLGEHGPRDDGGEEEDGGGERAAAKCVRTTTLSDSESSSNFSAAEKKVKEMNRDRERWTRRSYECLCAPGKRGPNCEWRATSKQLAQLCPTGWFGQFPQCKRCRCGGVSGIIGTSGEQGMLCDPQTGFSLFVIIYLPFIAFLRFFLNLILN